MPCTIRWPGKIKIGSVSNEIVSGHDWSQTFLAAAGEPDIKAELLKGHTIGDTTYKVHLDGYNQLPYLPGEVEKNPRRGFAYFNDDGDGVAVRYENWKAVFMEQRAPGTLQVWAERFTVLRVPKFFDLRADPDERAGITSNTYWDWVISNGGILYGVLAGTEEFLNTFKDYPPRQRASSFTTDQAMEKLRQNLGGK